MRDGEKRNRSETDRLESRLSVEDAIEDQMSALVQRERKDGASHEFHSDGGGVLIRFSGWYG